MGYGSLGIVGPHVASQSVSGNISIVQFGVDLYTIYSDSYTSGDTMYATLYKASGPNWDWVAIGSYSETVSFSGVVNGERKLTRSEIPVEHNNDGTLALRVEASFDWGSSGGPIYGSSGWVTIPTIARKSNLTCNQSEIIINDSNQITGSITPAADDFTHKLTITFGNFTDSVPIDNNTFNYTPLVNNFLTRIPDTNSGIATLTLTTYSGSTNLGSITTSIIIKPPSYSYAINTITKNPYYYPNSGGINPFGNIYMQLLTGVQVSIPTPVAKYGANIVASYITVDGITYNYDDIAIISNILNNSGSVAVTAYFEDSRGIRATKTDYIPVYEYAFPQAQFGASITYGQTHASLTLNGSASSILVSDTEQNNIKVTSLTRRDLSTTDPPVDITESTIPQALKDGISLTDFAAGYDFSDPPLDSTETLDASLSYEYVITFQDKATSLIITTASGITCISRHAGGDGVTFGGEATTGGLISKWDATFEKDVYIKNHSQTSKKLIDLIYPIGSIYMSVNATTPDNIFGGTWERLKNCFLYGGYDESERTSDWTKVCDEDESFTVTDSSIVYRFGTGDKWVEKVFNVGTYTASVDTFGNDPAAGILKEVYKDTSKIIVGDSGGVEKYALSASIGAVNSSPSILGYITEGRNSYQAEQEPNYNVIGATHSSGGAWNHSTPVTVFNSSSRSTTNMPPYLAVYMWKRTA